MLDFGQSISRIGRMTIESRVDNLHRRKSQIAPHQSILIDSRTPTPTFLEVPLFLLRQLGLVGLSKMPGNLFIQKFLLLFQCAGKKL